MPNAVEAIVRNYVAVQSLLIEGGRVTGAELVDQLTGESARVQARAVVNATGPWSDDLHRLEGATAARARVRGSKGAHILVPRARVGNREALTLLAPTDEAGDVRAPRRRLHRLFGTTDTYTDASPDEVRASEADVAYLLAAANNFFPAARLTRADVVSAWAGIRPLVATTADSPNAASREHAINVTPGGGVITITGGKLTTHRIMAQQVVDVVERRLGRHTPSRTATALRAIPRFAFMPHAPAMPRAEPVWSSHRRRATAKSGGPWSTNTPAPSVIC